MATTPDLIKYKARIDEEALEESLAIRQEGYIFTAFILDWMGWDYTFDPFTGLAVSEDIFLISVFDPIYNREAYDFMLEELKGRDYCVANHHWSHYSPQERFEAMEEIVFDLMGE